MVGCRHDVEHYDDLKPGEYGRWQDNWICKTPTDLIGNLKLHEVTEHEDGTITVSPSILIDASSLGTWHGFLERGVWREV